MRISHAKMNSSPDHKAKRRERKDSLMSIKTIARVNLRKKIGPAVRLSSRAFRNPTMKSGAPVRVLRTANFIKSLQWRHKAGVNPALCLFDF